MPLCTVTCTVPPILGTATIVGNNVEHTFGQSGLGEDLAPQKTSDVGRWSAG